MTLIKFVILSLLLVGNFLNAMVPAPAAPAPVMRFVKRTNQVAQQLDQLKTALFEKVSPSTIQGMIDEIRKTLREVKKLPEETGEVWKYVIVPRKALLVGNAESAARVVDLEVQQLIRRGKPVPAALQEKHANARTNIHLIKDFLYPLEKEMSYGLQYVQ